MFDIFFCLYLFLYYYIFSSLLVNVCMFVIERKGNNKFFNKSFFKLLRVWRFDMERTVFAVKQLISNLEQNGGLSSCDCSRISDTNYSH